MHKTPLAGRFVTDHTTSMVGSFPGVSDQTGRHTLKSPEAGAEPTILSGSVDYWGLSLIEIAKAN